MAHHNLPTEERYANERAKVKAIRAFWDTKEKEQAKADRRARKRAMAIVDQAFGSFWEQPLGGK